MSIKSAIKGIIEDHILTEAPLPSDWDSEIYDPRVPFKTRVEYAKARAEQVGRGSSRVAFKINYQGRPTVLKVAMNYKGMKQNEAEAELLNDWYLKGLKVTIPMIDYDERSNMPTWIHTEFAQKANRSVLRKFLAGTDVSDVVLYLVSQFGARHYRSIELPPATLETDLFQALEEIAGNYGSTMVEDLGRPANWGIYKGKPVIIDVGFTDNTRYLYT